MSRSGHVLAAQVTAFAWLFGCNTNHPRAFATAIGHMQVARSPMMTCLPQLVVNQQLWHRRPSLMFPLPQVTALEGMGDFEELQARAHPGKHTTEPLVAWPAATTLCRNPRKSPGFRRSRTSTCKSNCLRSCPCLLCRFVDH